jgi:hypothetical protein
MISKDPTPPPVNSREFVYRGNAVAAGGLLTKLNGKRLAPDATLISTHGESCLPLIGGVSRSSVQPVLPHPNFINYTDCQTFAWGRLAGDSTVTTLSASVGRIQLTTSPSDYDHVPDVASISFKAGHIFIEMESTHPQQGQPSIAIKQAQAEGMALIVTNSSGGVTETRIELVFDEGLMALPSMERMDQEFLKNRQFFDDQCRRFPTKPKPVFGRNKLPRTSQGYYSASMVKAIRFGDRVIEGHTLATKGFGTISFGLLLSDDYSRRISMARVKMGSDPAADIGFGGVETNGIWK